MVTGLEPKLNREPATYRCSLGDKAASSPQRNTADGTAYANPVLRDSSTVTSRNTVTHSAATAGIERFVAVVFQVEVAPVQGP